MQWFINNWSLLVVILACLLIAYNALKKFAGLPSEEQLLKVRELLLYLVIEAEKEFGSQTGQIKLRYVYSKFCEFFPSLVPVIPFDVFEKMVDSALEQMRHLIETNMAIKNYVEGGKAE